MRTATIKKALMISLSVLCGCAGSKHSGDRHGVMPGTWQATPVVIDGDNKEWPSPYPSYDSKAKIAYTTSNDSKYLYITMQTGDEMTEMKMLKNGMTVSIDTSGNKEASFSINYPLQNDNSELDLPMAPDGQLDNAIQFEKQLYIKVRKGIELANQLTLDGFNGCNGGYLVGQTTPCGIKVKARINEYKELVWEAAVPLNVLYGKETLTPAETGKPISVCYAIKGTKQPKNKGVDNANGGFNQAPGGGRNNAAMGGMPAGGGKGSRTENPLEHLYTSTKTWKQFTLVAQP